MDMDGFRLVRSLSKKYLRRAGRGETLFEKWCRADPNGTLHIAVLHDNSDIAQKYNISYIDKDR